ncbi:MAG: hypothetical protein Kow0056_11800 [Coriobacteriia bacterium]
MPICRRGAAFAGGRTRTSHSTTPTGVAFALVLLAVLAAVVLAPPVIAESDEIATCLQPCHGGLGIAPDVATEYDSGETNAGHRLNWDSKVVADSSGALWTQGSRMPCTECHVSHGQSSSSIYSFSEARTGGPITVVRQLCEGCHRPYDSSAATPTVAGMLLRKLPSAPADHGDASSRDCFDCHGGTGHSAEGHGGGADCSDCHGSDGSHAIHTSASDPRGPGGLACTGCHEAGNFPGFAAGSDSDGSGMVELDETTVCDDCHSPGGAYDGVDSSGDSVGAKDNWDSQVYETTSTLQAGKEKWCVGCHDGDCSVAGEEPSLISGVYAAPVGGDPTGEYIYGTGWGYYETGHGLATDVALPSSGGMQLGAGLECDDCHDLGKGHIDGDRWTYSAGSGNASYRDGYRLVEPDLGSGPVFPMLMPRTQSGGNSVLAPEAWALCASCHDSSPFLSGGSNDTNMLCTGTNEHRYHMSMNNIVYDSDHTGGADSRPQCITCHNVHGSKYLAMMRDGTLLDLEPGMPIWYWNSSLSVWHGNNTTPPDPQDLTLVASTGRARVGQPTFCGACHNHSYIDPPHDRGAPLYWGSGNPVLDWTWEPSYEGRGINTDRIFDTTYDVPFRVTYYDPDNDAPSTVEVWVDHDNDGSYEASETTVMSKYVSTDTTYTDGVIYEATVTVTDPGDKTMMYRFYAVEGTHTAAGQPTVDQTLVWDDNFMRDVPSEYDSIQDAIAAAYDGNTILVDDGAYSENLDTLGKGLTLVSVNGTSTTSIVGSASTAQPVITVSSGATSATIEGFVIDNAYDSMTVNGARGVYIESGTDVTIRDCEITDNNPKSGDIGGGIYMTGSGLIVENTAITDNWSKNGGAGVYAENTTHTISFTDCWIDDNTGDVYPGVYLVSCEATTTFTRTSISRNGIGGNRNTGGGLNASDSPVELYDCNVDDNVGGDASGEHGGGLWLSGSESAAYIEGGSISGNYCGGHGGGIYMSGSTASEPLTIKDCDMSGNRSNNQGGAIYATGIVGTIQLTNVDMDGSQAQYGGGAIYADCPVVVTGCSLDDCTSTHSSGPGGAIALSGANCSLAISDTTIARPWGNNTGGGIYVNGSLASVPVTATNVAITDGYGRTGGGGIFVGSCANMSYLTSVTVDGCSSYEGGGGIWTTSPMSIADSTITDNWCTHVPESGGGILANNSGILLVISDTSIDRNQADSGAGLAAYVSTLTITGGTINDNYSAPSNPGYNGGGVDCSGYVTVERTYIQGNRCGQKGGGLYIGSGSLVMTNCTVTGNSTGTHSSSIGGGVYSAVSSASLINCTLSANFSRQAGGLYGGGGLAFNGILWGNTASLQYPSASAATVSYSDITGSGYTDGGNNITAAPAFVATSTAYPSSAGDFHLRSISPCAGVGTSVGAPADDIDEESRPQGFGIDMGSDEILGGGAGGASKVGPITASLPYDSEPSTHTGPPTLPASDELGSGLFGDGFLLVDSGESDILASSGMAPVATLGGIAGDLAADNAQPLGMPGGALPAATLSLATLLSLAWRVIAKLL